jgi:restriction endonuclease XhoI-like protein
MKDLDKRLAGAVTRFWSTRDRQSEEQGSETGDRDRGGRSAVTGGAQMDGFVELVRDLLIESGIPDATVFRESKLELPGFFRPTKKWDLLVVVDNHLLAAMEFKSLVGSFGNNTNNRTEEALGNATDIRTAYREGAFAGSPQTWLGYLMLFEEAPRSTSPITVKEPHFNVFPEFRDASYIKRFELFCLKLVRERLYDAACLILSDRDGGPRGEYKEPNPEIGFTNFVASLSAKAIAYAKTHERS